MTPQPMTGLEELWEHAGMEVSADTTFLIQQLAIQWATGQEPPSLRKRWQCAPAISGRRRDRVLRKHGASSAVWP